MKIKKYQVSKKRLPAVIIVTAIVAVTAGYFVYAGTQGAWPFEKALVSQTNSENEQLTDEQQAERDRIDSQSAKKRATENNQSSEPETKTEENNNKTKISIGVTSSSVYDDNLEIRAFTTNVIEGTGTCKAVLTKGNLKVEESTKAFIDSRSSICQPIYIPVKSFTSSGKWNLVLTYESPTSSGSTEAIEVDIP